MAAFADRLFGAVEKKGSAVVVGLDPDPRLIPRAYFPAGAGTGGARERLARGVVAFCEEILDAVRDVAVAVKPQLAYYERLGPAGMAAYERIVELAQQRGLLVIADGKRNDIASTAAQYAAAYLGGAGSHGEPAAAGAEGADGAWLDAADQEGPKADALTVNPYLGWDGIEPFVTAAGRERGLFVLVKTSNPSSAQLQDRIVAAEKRPLSVAEVVAGWLEEFAACTKGACGYGSVGAVVGATHPRQLAALRQAMPHVPFLIPGYGAQGGTAQDVAGGFDAQGRGAVVNASRSILYAYRAAGRPVAEAARRAAVEMRDALRRALGL